MINCALFGDSIAAGAYLDASGLQHRRDTLSILHSAQNQMQFTNYAVAGASFTGFLHTDAITREGNGLPNGITLEEFIAGNPQYTGYLFEFGGNDNAIVNPAAYEAKIHCIANACKSAGKIFAFVGVVNVNASESYNYLRQFQPDTLHSPLAQHAAAIAYNAELLRQVCVHYGYPCVDLRNTIQVDLGHVTMDIVHPNDKYFAAIWTRVGKALVGQ